MWKNERTKMGFEKSRVLYVMLDNTSQAYKSVEFESYPINTWFDSIQHNRII